MFTTSPSSSLDSGYAISRSLPIIGMEHGGQSWKTCDSYIEDCSVTTNFMGPPGAALEAAKNAMLDIHHYPCQSADGARRALSAFFGRPSRSILVGNGASEFIELVVRLSPDGAFRLSPYNAQYSEYERAARICGRSIIAWEHEKPASVTVIIQPNSPTGDFLPLDDLRALIEEKEGMFLIDESFLMFKGEDWRLSSAMNLIEEFPDRLVVIVSLTKIWSCPGLRIGAVVASDEWIGRIAQHQVPWSCNVMAQAFIEHACRDSQYLKATWSTIPVWKSHIHDLIRKGGWSFNESSPLWAPWVFMLCGSDKEAEELFTLATDVGIPVRWCKSHGIPCYLRIGVRAPDTMNILFGFWIANAKRFKKE